MANGHIKFDVPDPGDYDALIFAQKKKTVTHPEVAAEWLELGRLQELKNQLTHHILKKKWLIRWLPMGVVSSFLLGVWYFSMHKGVLPLAISLPVLFLSFAVLRCWHFGQISFITW